MSCGGLIVLGHREALVRELLIHLIAKALPIMKVTEIGDPADASTRKTIACARLILAQDEWLHVQQSSVRALCAAFPQAIVVLIGAKVQRSVALAAMMEGARAYLSTDMHCAEIVHALREICSFGARLPLLAQTVETCDPIVEVCTDPRLTRRQQDVMSLIMQGQSNKQIGRQLAISEATVKVHIASIFRALNVANRVSAINATRSFNPAWTAQDPDMRVHSLIA